MSNQAQHPNLIRIIEQQYGSLFFKNAKGKICGVNPLSFTNYLSCKLLIRFCTDSQSFIKYDSKSGIWSPISKDKVRNILWETSLHILEQLEDGAAKFVSNSLVGTILKLFKPIVEHKKQSITDKRYYHAANCMLVFDLETGKWVQEPFSSKFDSHSQSKIVYDPDKKCPRFLNELLRSAITEADIEMLQLYLGQCLLTTNFVQMFLILTGTGGAGKSVLVNIIEEIIGKEHCAELRPSHTDGRFEMGSYRGRKLLFGKDVTSEYLNNSGARSLKVLTGNDMVTAEYKNANKRDNFDGNFNIIITSNNTLRLKFDGDKGAWKRRILLINYVNPPPEKKIPNFDDVLIAEEGSGILNWVMEGAVKLVQNGLIIEKNEYQKAAVDNFLKSSDPFRYFGELFIHPTPGAALSSAEVVEYFTKFCHINGWDVPTERQIQKELSSYMGEEYGASVSHSIKRNDKSKRGYYNFQIRNKKEE